MKQEIHIDHLIRSLESVRQFANSEAEFDEGAEFMNLHMINRELLEKLSLDRSHSYFREKVAEYPRISAREIDEYLADRKDGGYRDRAGLSYLREMILFILDLLGSEGRSVSETAEKLQAISAINESIIYVLRNPGMEELISSK